MGSRAAALAVVVGLSAFTAGGATAVAATQTKPRAGSFAGQVTVGNDAYPVSFTVSKNRQRVVNFVGQAQTKDGCTNHITGFQAPNHAMRISNGHFSATSSSYPQNGVRVKVTGRFTSRTTARGHISVRIAHVKGCNASRLFTAVRQTG